MRRSQRSEQTSNANGDFASGEVVPLLIPPPVSREWKMNGVGVDALGEWQAEYAQAVDYEFDWGQIIEGAFDVDHESESEDPRASVERRGAVERRLAGLARGISR